MSETITISLTVKNSYEGGRTVVKEFVNQEIPAPPGVDQDYDEYTAWVDEEIINRFTGTGLEEGDAWYDVRVTACSEPRLVGLFLTFG